MSFDLSTLATILGSIGTAAGLISFVWQIRNSLRQQSLEKLEFKREFTPLIDIGYTEIGKTKYEGNNLVLGEISLTNKSKYQLSLVGFGIYIQSLRRQNLSSILFRTNEDLDDDEIVEEFGKLSQIIGTLSDEEVPAIFDFDNLVQVYPDIIKTEIPDLESRLAEIKKSASRKKDVKVITKFEDDIQKIIAKQKNPAKIEFNIIDDYIHYCTMKYGSDFYLKRFLNYTLDPQTPLQVPVIFQYTNDGFYKLYFKVSAVPAGEDWREKAKLYGITYRIYEGEREKGKAKGKVIPALIFAEEFVKYLNPM